MNPHVEVEIARRTLVDGWQSFGYDVGHGWGTEKNTEKGGTFKTGGGIVNRNLLWHTIPDRILTASPHLQGYDVPGDEIDKLKAQGLTLLEALEEMGID